MKEFKRPMIWCCTVLGIWVEIIWEISWGRKFFLFLLIFRTVPRIAASILHIVSHVVWIASPVLYMLPSLYYVLHPMYYVFPPMYYVLPDLYYVLPPLHVFHSSSPWRLWDLFYNSISHIYVLYIIYVYINLFVHLLHMYILPIS